MKKLAYILGAFLLLSNCGTHGSGGENIRIEVSVIGKSDSDRFNSLEGNFYSVRIDLINNTDSIIRFWTMSCSWEDNWISNAKTIYLFNPGCDSNYPYIVKVESGKTITFMGTVRVCGSIEEAGDSNYKLGFILIREKEVVVDLDFRKVLRSKGEKGLDLIWSEPFKINK